MGLQRVGHDWAAFTLGGVVSRVLRWPPRFPAPQEIPALNVPRAVMCHFHFCDEAVVYDTVALKIGKLSGWGQPSSHEPFKRRVFLSWSHNGKSESSQSVRQIWLETRGAPWQDIYACKLCMIWRDNVEGSKLNYLQGILKEHENQDHNGQNVTDILLKF